jgi:GT2 family glycosyltransferase
VSSRPTSDLEVPAVAPLGQDELPRVCVVILNWNGRQHLAGCFDSLQAMDYPEDLREVVLVDNGSDDGSVQEVRSRYPWVRLEVNDRNLGFSAGCNQGARLATDPDLLVFLNNDIRVDPGFLRALVAPVVRGTCVATTAKMLSWDGKCLNSAGGGMNFYGLGIQRGYLAKHDPVYDQPRRTLFACGGAMSMDARVFDQVGGFDEQFFAYYEDVDLGWRTWVQGHEVHYVPDAVCYHHHSSTSSRVPVERLRLLQVRNPLLACFKNYDDDNLRRILPAMLALATRRAFLSSGLSDLGKYRIEQLASLPRPTLLGRLWARLRGAASRRESLSRVGVADLIAINDLIGQWDHWKERRAEVQARRARPDGEILPLLLDPLWCIEGDHGYKELQHGLEAFLGIDELFAGLTTLEQNPYQDD